MDNGYDQINKAWKNTCKILLGEEVGELLEFRDYLKMYKDPIEKRSSLLSGKQVTISSDKISKDAKVISYEEIAQYQKKFMEKPLDINQIKDIDSLCDAVKERVCYSGNVVLGNSANVVDSHRCVNSHYLLECQDVYNAKYVAFSTSLQSPSYTFGSTFGSKTNFVISIFDPYEITRCMELFHGNVVSDSYYCSSMENCNNCMFSFNQRHKQYLIGNIELNKDKYSELKKKLLSEIADSLKRKKSVLSILDIIRGN